MANIVKLLILAFISRGLSENLEHNIEKDFLYENWLDSEHFDDTSERDVNHHVSSKFGSWSDESSDYDEEDIENLLLPRQLSTPAAGSKTTTHSITTPVKPLSTTNRPVLTTSHAPTSTTTRPVPKTLRPVITTSRPQASSSNPSTTTPAPTTLPMSITSPVQWKCITSCSATSEYNPVCGSNGITYFNAGRLACAQSCGVDVTQVRTGKCNVRDAPTVFS